MANSTLKICQYKYAFLTSSILLKPTGDKKRPKSTQYEATGHTLYCKTISEEQEGSALGLDSKKRLWFGKNDKTRLLVTNAFGGNFSFSLSYPEP